MEGKQDKGRGLEGGKEIKRKKGRKKGEKDKGKRGRKQRKMRQEKREEGKEIMRKGRKLSIREEWEDGEDAGGGKEGWQSDAC